MSKDNKQYSRNIRGKELESKGDIDGAIAMYEQNIAENFEGNYPYDRLAVIYHKRKQYEEEKRVLLHGIYVFDNIVYRGRGDRVSKLNRFKNRLDKLENIIYRQTNVQKKL